MALPKPRLDSYGRPIAPLVDACEEILYDRPFNIQQRRHLLHNLDEQFQALLRRGQYAEVQIGFRVQDGVIQAELSICVTHQRRYERED
jgi:hypothetical protein